MGSLLQSHIPPPGNGGFSGSPQALSTPGPHSWAPGAPGAVAHMGSGRHVFELKS